jgi:hypothetical protein
MACGCKKNAAAKSASVVKTTTAPTQESTPQKKIGNRIIKREIR